MALIRLKKIIKKLKAMIKLSGLENTIFLKKNILKQRFYEIQTTVKLAGWPMNVEHFLIRKSLKSRSLPFVI